MNADIKTRIEERLRLGESIRWIAKSMNITVGQVRWVSTVLKNTHPEIPCPCGQNRSHRGLCHFRTNNSAVKAYHAKRRSDFVTRNLEIQITGFRVCTKCKKKRPVDCFYVRKATGAIVKYIEQCKKCRKKSSALRWKNNSDFRQSGLARNKKWKNDNRGKCYLYTKKYRDKNPGAAIRSVGSGMFYSSPASFIDMSKADRFLSSQCLDPLEALIAKEEYETKERRDCEVARFGRYEAKTKPMMSLAESFQLASL